MTVLTMTTIPHTPGFPLVGSLYAYRRNPLAFLLHTAAVHGDISAFRLGPWPVILLNSPELVRMLLLDHAEAVDRGAYARFLGQLALGNGLLTSPRIQHRKQRKLIFPAFQRQRITAYADMIVAYTQEFQASWRDGEVLEIDRAMLRLTLRIVGKMLFNIDLLDETDSLAMAMTTAMRYVDTEFNALIRLPSTWPTPRNRQFRQAVEVIDTMIYRIIAERRQNNDNPGDLLSLLMQSYNEHDGTPMSDTQLRDEVFALFAAGHETIASVLVWTWYLLARHPQVYARVQAEGDQVLAGRLPSYADLAALPYTLQVIKEVIRLYPPIWVFTREVQHPIVMNNHPIAPGTTMMVSPYVLHRHPRYFPNPTAFNPERFTPEAEQVRPYHAYIPFSGGPHTCIGNRLALMELHLIVATLVQRTCFETVSRQRAVPEPLVTLRPQSGLKLRVRPRDLPVVVGT